MRAELAPDLAPDILQDMKLEFYQLSSQKQSSSAMLVGCASLTSHHFARLPRQFIWRLALLAT
jgi:hypothetical protein